jgi:uncharacterized membrane protein YraQ (UPF0718 family)
VAELIWGVLLAAATVFAQMAPYLLLGFFLAGWLYVLISRETVARMLGHHRRMGPIWAALVGVPLPLCSCGVLPFARLLKDRGASPGSIVSFLLTTPQTGIDSILVSASILGWPLTFWKIGTAFVSGVLGGFAANAVAPGIAEAQATTCEPEHSCCSSKARPEPTAPVADCCSGKQEKSAEKSCCGGHEEVKKPKPAACCRSSEEEKPEPARASCCGESATKAVAGHEHREHPGKLRAALYYGFFQNLGDVAGWLILGLLAAGAISYAVPEDFFGHTLGGGWAEMLAVLVISMLLYVCATGSVPIGAALAAKGLSAGAVMVFLIAGPAVSAVSIAVLGKTLGRRLLFVYLATIVFISVVSGMAFNAYFHDFGKTILTTEHCEHLSGWQWVCTALLGGALAFHFIQRAVRILGKAWLRICPECLSFCLKGCACCGCSH